MAVRVRVEFTVEPFREGGPGRHVEAALHPLREAGFPPEVGPFGNTVEGEAGPLLQAVGQALAASVAAGATAVSLTARAVPHGDEADEFLAALEPLAGLAGADVVASDDLPDDAVPLVWKGRLVGGLRPGARRDLRRQLAHLVGHIEADLGAPLADLDRVGKQRAVSMLDEGGAFAVRNAVDEVADAMGVSRVTVYNYLNATRSAAGAP